VVDAANTVKDKVGDAAGVVQDKLGDAVDGAKKVASALNPFD
jgi:hypothetical protein